MSKIRKEVIVTGEQLPDMDVVALARVIVRFVRHQHSKAESESLVSDGSAAADTESA